jgi:hypothetical protein
MYIVDGRDVRIVVLLDVATFFAGDRESMRIDLIDYSS